MLGIGPLCIKREAAEALGAVRDQERKRSLYGENQDSPTYRGRMILMPISVSRSDYPGVK